MPPRGCIAKTKSDGSFFCGFPQEDDWLSKVFCGVQDEGVGAMGCANVPRYGLSSVSHVWQKPGSLCLHRLPGTVVAV